MKNFVLLISVFLLFSSLDTSANNHLYNVEIISSNKYSHVFNVELADDDLERSVGLMWRSDLNDNEGMLFKWNNSKIRKFWMKNTPLSLDIIFINEDKIITNIAHKTTPFSLIEINSIFPSRYVLEVIGGKCKKLKINIGDKVNF
tara:strand:+ start:1300 stop:1734 length:435 start_codon:yes stop_codon:yes gene_type:complete